MVKQFDVNEDKTGPSHTERRQRHVSVDLTPEQKAELVRLAKRSGLNTSQYLRAVVTLAIRKQATYRMEFAEEAH